MNNFFFDLILLQVTFSGKYDTQKNTCTITSNFLLLRLIRSYEFQPKQMWYDTQEETCTNTSTFLLLQLICSFELILIMNIYSSETYNFYLVLSLFQQLQWRAWMAVFTITKDRNGERRVARNDTALLSHPSCSSGCWQHNLLFWLVQVMLDYFMLIESLKLQFDYIGVHIDI